jgi:hypothetical protein
MAILLERKVWRKESRAKSTHGLNRLTPDEEQNVLAALRVLRARRGSWNLVAHAMEVTKRPAVGLQERGAATQCRARVAGRPVSLSKRGRRALRSVRETAELPGMRAAPADQRAIAAPRLPAQA